eukprot:TRINITY_DN12109_c0_g1_i1.p1 TRINITY_DN12109_c0_g1~~TRINITY_DN12109_c0_g1_i1.p1  ORF type:complete len:693 (+),score=303.25 TRINITY_DN12109_c0_g1_i1:32-2080(+)
MSSPIPNTLRLSSRDLRVHSGDDDEELEDDFAMARSGSPSIVVQTSAAEFDFRAQRESHLFESEIRNKRINPLTMSLSGSLADSEVMFNENEFDESPETHQVCDLLKEASNLRDKYLYVPKNATKAFAFEPMGKCPPPPKSDFVLREFDGIFMVYESEDAFHQKKPINKIFTLKKFVRDFHRLMFIVSDGAVKSFCYKRLKLLKLKFEKYILFNSAKETAAQKIVPHRDFYNIHKVDGHVHHSSCMNHKHLLKFIKMKLKTCPDDVVIFRDGKELTLKGVFESLNLTAYDLSVDTLDCHAHNDTFHRFDKFNLKYNPFGQSRLREIFLKTDNFIKGKYLAELTREVFDQLDETKYQCAEYRLSIYGRDRQEWTNLSTWVENNNLYSPNVRWMIQIPRLYALFRTNPALHVGSFRDVLSAIFQPLFEVTLDPESNPVLFRFLCNVVAFDTVDDESTLEPQFDLNCPEPAEWTAESNPPYSYYLFYLYVNLYNLNNLREQRGLNTFAFRPHAGEAGDVSHLASSFLTAHGINHGITLKKAPALQYLYYLHQIGLAMSPLSNNSLFLSYNKNPFFSYFKMGLNVALSTDDPLQFHYSREALIEEYSVAKAVWKLSSTDMSEIARNSVLQSSFEHSVKASWLGPNYYLASVKSNDINKTNVPDLRLCYRFDTLKRELKFILGHIST